MDRHEAVEPSHHLVTPVIFGRRIEFCLGVSREGRNLLVGGILVFEQSDLLESELYDIRSGISRFRLSVRRGGVESVPVYN